MKKKMVSVLLTAAMGASLLAGCGSEQAESVADTAEQTAETVTETVTETAEQTAEAVTEQTAEATEEITDYGTGEIKVWVADNVVDFTKETIDKWQTENPQYAGYTVTVEAVGEGDAAGNMITDVTAGADIYGFAQDQTARLVAAGALVEVAPENVSAIENDNAAGAVVAATVGDTLYA